MALFGVNDVLALNNYGPLTTDYGHLQQVTTDMGTVS